MGNRLTRIYTRTGDDGTTGLGDGSRTPKDAMRIEAMGAVDELNSAIGVLLANDLDDTSRSTLTDIQHSLFDLGGELSMPGASVITDDRVMVLEDRMDTMNDGLAPLKEFILPGGSSAAAACHLARAICRRAERRLHSLSKTDTVNPASIRFLNRLSDLLFVLARHINKDAAIADVFWQHERNQ
jgi:cob(I)alamin adenosyltransferase